MNLEKKLICDFIDDAISICWNRKYDYCIDDDVYTNYMHYVMLNIDCNVSDASEDDGLEHELEFTLG